MMPPRIYVLPDSTLPGVGTWNAENNGSMAMQGAVEYVPSLESDELAELRQWKSDMAGHIAHADAYFNAHQASAAELTRLRAQAAAADKLAEAAKVAKNQARNNRVIASINTLDAALAVYLG